MKQQEPEGSQDRGKKGFRISSNTMKIFSETENTKRGFEKPSSHFLLLSFYSLFVSLYIEGFAIQ